LEHLFDMCRTDARHVSILQIQRAYYYNITHWVKLTFSFFQLSKWRFERQRRVLGNSIFVVFWETLHSKFCLMFWSNKKRKGEINLLRLKVKKEKRQGTTAKNRTEDKHRK